MCMGEYDVRAQRRVEVLRNAPEFAHPCFTVKLMVIAQSLERLAYNNIIVSPEGKS